MEDIKSLFQIRDNSVARKDYRKFSSTQVDNIVNASINGYISSKELKTEVLNVVEVNTIKKVAFVKENYGIHSAFLLYYLVNTIEGWKIYDIVSSAR